MQYPLNINYNAILYSKLACTVREQEHIKIEHHKNNFHYYADVRYANADPRLAEILR